MPVIPDIWEVEIRRSQSIACQGKIRRPYLKNKQKLKQLKAYVKWHSANLRSERPLHPKKKKKRTDTIVRKSLKTMLKTELYPYSLSVLRKSMCSVAKAISQTCAQSK
jgi:hypothetical protein